MWAGFFLSSRRRHTRFQGDWSSVVCSSDLCGQGGGHGLQLAQHQRHVGGRVLGIEQHPVVARAADHLADKGRSEEHTSELQSPCISYAVFCLKKKKKPRDSSCACTSMRPLY